MTKYSKPIVGQVIGRYQFLENIGIDKWKVICLGKDQGSLSCTAKEKIITLSNFRKNKSQSCGCLNHDKREETYIGKTFGDLTITKIYRKNRRLWAKANCICGNIWEGNLFNVIKNNHSSSCGCRSTINKHKSKRRGEAGFLKSVRSVKNSASSRKLEFKLTNNQLRIIFESNCIYCNRKPSYKVEQSSIYETSKQYSQYIRSTVDRVDSSKGYINGNVVPACKICNYGKWDYSLEYYLEWINENFKNPTTKFQFYKKLEELTNALGQAEEIRL